MSENVKRSPGRPTKYDPSYCDEVIEFCSQGYSLSAFAGKIRVTRQSITDWRNAHPDFDEACQIAKGTRAYKLEDGLLNEQMGAAQINARRFALVNCAPDDWREKQDVAHTVSGPDGGAVQVVTHVKLVGVDPGGE